MMQRSPVRLVAVHEDVLTPRLNFDQLFDRFAPYVAAVALRLLGDASQVEDLVQEVFLDCFRTINKLNNLEHARRWLVKVTVRKAVRRLRKKKIAIALGLSDSDVSDLPMPSATADERGAISLLYCLLARMPVNYRMVWSLRFLEGAEIQEIADACGCSVATVKRRLREASRMITGESHD
jgi:RNA polymerase sigma-70 factor (ECF subfamily)